ncbi:hypothetical protein L7F22_044813 [Adiantum nelumboides]|nr:hypothetical protein [Adiantum nelumboides]
MEQDRQEQEELYRTPPKAKQTFRRKNREHIVSPAMLRADKMSKTKDEIMYERVQMMIRAELSLLRSDIEKEMHTQVEIYKKTMYADIRKELDTELMSVQLGFQYAAGSYRMPEANMGMAGFSQPDAQNLNMASRPGGNFGSGMPLLNAPHYDNLTPKGKPKDYKEGGQAVKFDTFHGTHDKLKALLFLQQFDAAFPGNRPNAENQQFRPPPFSRQRQGFKRHFTGKTTEESKALRDAKKCYVCEEGHFANECPQRNSQNKDDKSDRNGKKPKPSAVLVPDLVGDQQNVDATELCRAWGKVRDQEVLVFFDPGAHATFISPELASKLEIRAEEMGMTGEAGLACPSHSEAATSILGKLRLHIQSYVDAEEFHIMPLQDCDVLLGIPWCYRLHAVVDTFHKKITLVHRGKTHVLDVKIKGDSVPVVSASAISSAKRRNSRFSISVSGGDYAYGALC